jgi:signal recognition particle receptor subunit beta
VLADTRRLDDCFGAVDFFESRNIPFIIAVNCFDGANIYDDEVRQALAEKCRKHLIGERARMRFLEGTAFHSGVADDIGNYLSN